MNNTVHRFYRTRKLRIVLLTRGFQLLSSLIIGLLVTACTDHQLSTTPELVQVPDGYRLEKVVDGLNFPTSLAWDAQQQLYVAEAGGEFLPEPQPAR